MKTYRRILYHIVFATRNRRNSLPDEAREDLYRYIWGICKNLDCYLFRIGGYRDHLHLLVELDPSRSLAEFMRIIKANSSRWMHQEANQFPAFENWQQGYAAFTVSYEHLDRVVSYIKNQEEHHRSIPFLDEYKALMNEAGIELDERYLP